MRLSFIRQLREGANLSFAKLVAGVVKIKLIAIALGVQGVGLLSLAMQIQSMALTLISLSLAVVIINQGRSYMAKGNLERAGEVLGTGIVLMSANTFFVVLIAYGLNENFQLSSQIGISPGALVALGFSAVLMASSSIVWESTCFLIDKYPFYVRVNIVSAFVDSVVIASCAWFYGLNGALYALILTSAVQFVVYYFVIIKDHGARELLVNLSVDRTLFLSMFKQALSAQGTSIIVQLSPLLARGYIILTSGYIENGYLQVATALAAYLLPFIMNGVWGHLHPFVAEHGDSTESRKELAETLEKVMPIAAIACVFLVIFSPLLISISYTSDFLPARKLMLLYFAAEIFFIGLSVLTTYLIALKKYKYSFLLYLSYHSIIAASVFISSDKLGSMSYVIGHAIGVFIIGSISMMWLIKNKIIYFDKFKITGLVIFICEVCIISEACDIFILDEPSRLAWYIFPILLIVFLKHNYNK